MPKRSRRQRRPTDLNELAAAIAAEATSQAEPEPETPDQEPVPETATPTSPPVKNPAAVALGRLGGIKGGKARAEALSPAKRKAIARKAAKARWGEKGR